MPNKLCIWILVAAVIAAVIYLKPWQFRKMCFPGHTGCFDVTGNKNLNVSWGLKQDDETGARNFMFSAELDEALDDDDYPASNSRKFNRKRSLIGKNESIEQSTKENGDEEMVIVYRFYKCDIVDYVMQYILMSV